MSRFIRAFEELGLSDVELVGGKNASLGEMIRELTDKGVRIPSGFVITADAYTELLQQGEISKTLFELLGSIDKTQVSELSRIGQAARNKIKEAGLPAELAEEIKQAYRKLELRYGPDVDVAVRSSATAEDLPDASFAGQQETFLNVRGEASLLEACLNCFASLFTDRAIAYRIDKGFGHSNVRLSIGVQKMVRSDLSVSGVMFTLDPETGFRDAILITSAYGLGENVVAGRVDPDEWLVFKPSLDEELEAIIHRKLGAKQQRMVYSGHGTRTTKNVDVPSEERNQLSLSDAQVCYLAKWAMIIEQHYSRLYGRWTPMDIEWARDGQDGHLYVVQARPETVHSGEDPNRLRYYELQKSRKNKLLVGRAVGQKIGAGAVRVINSSSELHLFKDGEVLVAEMTDPDWEPVMKRAAGIVTNRGGRTCHAAIVSRELGVPCIVGTHNATEILKNDQPVTVSCAEGANGSVYDGFLKYEVRDIRLDEIPRPKTQVMLNVGNPQHAFRLAQLPVDGVGLAREEFIIANDVRIHPLALTRFDELKDASAKRLILEITRGYSPMTEYFVDKLAEGIAMIAAAFSPRDVIVRLSDFKTNEYAGLIGGSQFEVAEDNPMIGFRGACRYYDERYRDGFELECRALKKVRNAMGFRNVKVMIPFCRTVEEGRKVMEVMKSCGLERGLDGLEIYVMCELPSNILAIDEFAQIFDGFSIGSNDLTQLVLGVDRDAENLSELFDERNIAVLRAIETAIKGAHRHGRKIGICGQAPSDYPEMVDFLIREGIDSISLSEDAVMKTLMAACQAEGLAEKSLSAV